MFLERIKNKEIKREKIINQWYLYYNLALIFKIKYSITTYSEEKNNFNLEKINYKLLNEKEKQFFNNFLSYNL